MDYILERYYNLKEEGVDVYDAITSRYEGSHNVSKVVEMLKSFVEDKAVLKKIADYENQIIEEMFDTLYYNLALKVVQSNFNPDVPKTLQNLFDEMLPYQKDFNERIFDISIKNKVLVKYITNFTNEVNGNQKKLSTFPEDLQKNILDIISNNAEFYEKKEEAESKKSKVKSTKQVM